MAEKKSFSETRVYPIFFMIILTIVFVGVLATFYHSTQDRVQSYKAKNLQTTILTLFDLPTENLEASYKKHIKVMDKEVTIDGETVSMRYYEASDGDKMLGYSFPVSGSGLWSTITAMLAVTPDLKEIVNLEIISQNETPGLGGRIVEDWFKNQFSKKQIVQGSKISLFNLIPEKDKANSNDINQITGATASSKAVVDMLYKDMKKISKALGLNYE